MLTVKVHQMTHVIKKVNIIAFSLQLGNYSLSKPNCKSINFRSSKLYQSEKSQHLI